jgi:hypothetical protein
MPDHSFRVVHAAEFLHTTASGGLDYETSRALLDAIVTSNEGPGLDLLIDVRSAADAGISFKDVYRLVSVLQEHPAAFRRKVAVLDLFRPGFEKVQFFESTATDAGFDVRSFLDYEAAAGWLQRSTAVRPTQEG